MAHFLLFYEVGPDYLERRGKFRDEHLRKAWASSEQGELVLGGILTEPVDRAVLLFRAESRETVEAFANSDPYVTNGLVQRWTVREWTTVAGLDATAPVKPSVIGPRE